jgi:hypothetical protein
LSSWRRGLEGCRVVGLGARSTEESAAKMGALLSEHEGFQPPGRPSPNGG